MSRARNISLAIGLLALIVAGLGAFHRLSGQSPAPVAQTVADTIVVHKSPTCGCCGAWVDHLKAAGFSVEVHDEDDMDALKSRLGMPARFASCHTARVGGYLIEGHVPAADIRRLLREKPEGQGLAVPGMPMGSPGMEMGDHREPYQTLLFKGEEATIFARHGEG